MGNWGAKIYVNGKMRSSLKVDNSTALSEIRNSMDLGDNDDELHFISRKGGFIRKFYS